MSFTYGEVVKKKNTVFFLTLWFVIEWINLIYDFWQISVHFRDCSGMNHGIKKKKEEEKEKHLHGL